MSYRKFQVGCPKNSECKTAKVSHDLNPPIESKLSRDNLDSIGGFKSCDTFAVLHSEFGRSKQPEKHGRPLQEHTACCGRYQPRSQAFSSQYCK